VIGAAPVVAIHQPNHLPWLGYFHKIARADIFVFLDHVQYSKNSIINRAKVLDGTIDRWLTIPVQASLGQSINAVVPKDAGWPDRHIAVLANYYRRATCFRDVWPQIEALFADLPSSNLAAINMALIRRLCERLEISTQFETSSSLDVKETTGGDMLVQLVSLLVKLLYTDFSHPVYKQSGREFLPGLSVLDAIFNAGWRAVGDFFRQPAYGA
jgi:hypothetical protein